MPNKHTKIEGGNGFLIIRRKEDQAVKVVHEESGDEFVLRVYGILGERPGHKAKVNISFGDHKRSFRFIRAEVLGREAGSEAGTEEEDIHAVEPHAEEMHGDQAG